MSISVDNISSYMDTIKSTNSSSSLDQTLSSDLSGATDEELMDACKDFEAYFIEQVLKEVEKTIPSSENQDASMSQLTDYYKEEMIQSLAGQVGEQSNNSFAQQMYEQMKRNYSL